MYGLLEHKKIIDPVGCIFARDTKRTSLLIGIVQTETTY